MNKDIDTFVLEFVTSTGGNNQCVIRKFMSGQCICHFQDALACSLSLGGELCTLGNKIGLKSVHQDCIALLVQEFLTFTAGYIAYSSKAVHMMSGLSLNTVLGFHVQLSRHLRAVISPKIIVKRLSVSGNASSDACGMGCKNGGNLRNAFLYIKRTQAGHPFMSLIHHVICIVQKLLVETLHHPAGSIREHIGFVIVAISMQAVYLIIVPSLGIQLITNGKKGIKIHKHNKRFAGNIPSADTNAESFFFCFAYPFCP